MKKWLILTSVLAVPTAIILNIIAVNFFPIIARSDIGLGVFSLITGLAPGYGFIVAVIAQKKYKEYRKINNLGMVTSLIGYFIVISSMEFWRLPFAILYIPVLLAIPLTCMYLLGEWIYSRTMKSAASH